MRSLTGMMLRAPSRATMRTSAPLPFRAHSSHPTHSSSLSFSALVLLFFPLIVLISTPNYSLLLSRIINFGKMITLQGNQERKMRLFVAPLLLDDHDLAH